MISTSTITRMLVWTSLLASIPLAFGQATPPDGTMNVAANGLFTAPSIVGGDPERLGDGSLTNAWLAPITGAGSTTTPTVLWSVPSNFHIDRVDLRQNNDGHRFNQVVVTILDTTGAVVSGPMTYNNLNGWNISGTGNTLQIPLSVDASTIRLDFSQPNAAAGAFAGFMEMWVWTNRPGAVDPLGAAAWTPGGINWIGTDHEPQIRDDEVVMFYNDGASDTISVLNQSPLSTDNWRWTMNARGTTSNSTVVAAAAGRVLGDPVEQVVVVRRPNNANNPFRLELLNLFNGQWNVLGTYTFSPANRDSDVCVVVGELDDGDHPELPNAAVRDGRRCSEVALAYEVVGSDNNRRVRLDLLNWANLSRDDVAAGVARAPNNLVPGGFVLNTGAGNTGNVGRLLHQDGTANRIRMEVARCPNAGNLIIAHGQLEGTTERVSVAAISPYGVRTNAAAIGGILRAQDMYNTSSARIGLPLDTADDFSDTWELAVGRFTRFDANDVNIGGDNVAIITAQNSTGDSRIDVATWEGDNTGAGTLRFRSRYAGNVGDDITGTPTVRIRPTFPVVHLPSIRAHATQHVANPDTVKALAVMYHTNRGPIVQTYGVGRLVAPAPVSPGTISWPSVSDFNARGTFTGSTSANFVSSIVPFDRGVLGNSPGAEVRLFIKDSDFRTSLAQRRYPQVYSDPISSAPQADVSFLTTTGGAANYQNVIMLTADVDGDSAWHNHTNNSTTLRLGLGTRLAFRDVATPRIILEEPPRHADYIRALHAVQNVSRKSGFNAQFTNQTSTTRSFERQSEVSTSNSQKVSGTVSETTSVEVPSIDPAVSASETASYTQAVQSLATTTGTHVLTGSRTITDTQTFNTAAGDQLVFKNRSFDMWNYPVMGFPDQTTPVFDFILDPYLRLGVPADDAVDVVTGANDHDGFAYQPEHIVGNIFSYPWFDSGQGQTIAMARFSPRTNGFNRAGVQRTFPNTSFTSYSVGSTSSTLTIQFDQSTNSSDSYSTSSSTTDTTDVTVSATVEASGSIFDGLVGVSGSVTATGEYSTEATQSFSQMSTRSISGSVQNQFQLNVTPVGDSSYSYSFLPLMWFDKSGAARLSHLVSIPSSDFWVSNYGGPDVALNLPRRISGLDDTVALSTALDRAKMKGYEVRGDTYGAGYPTTERYLSDGQLNPAFEMDTDYPKSRNPILSSNPDGGSARDGQTVTLRARVYNLALHRTASIANNVRVRFEAQEIDSLGGSIEVGPRVRIGDTIIPTINGQENHWAQMMWNTTFFGACSPTGDPRHYRIYVIVDPNDRITNETHELFDRDNDPLLDSGTRQPIDFYNGQALEKGQNNMGWFPFAITPNPLGNGATAPAVTAQPVSQTRDIGTSVTFTAAFSGTPTITYQWRHGGAPITDDARISGATTTTLTINNIQLADAGTYRCVATNSCGSAQTANNRRLTVNTPACPADLDDGSGTGTPDGGVTIDDLLYYLDQYAQGNTRADLDDGSGTGTPDGGVTIDDLLYFLARYTAGC